MVNKKTYQIALFIVVAILLNYFGKLAGTYFNLPLWMDSFGTVLTAYICGPFCGAVVGLTGNILFSFYESTSLLYGLTNIAIGVIAGLSAKRQRFDSMFGTMTTSALIALTSIVISTPINMIFYGGNTGNLWGDSVIAYLSEMKLPSVFCMVAGEFYIDFLDKVITLLMLYLLIKLHRLRKKRENKVEKSVKISTKMIVLFVGLFLLSFCKGAVSHAESVDEQGLNTYVQTIYNSDNGLMCGTANDVEQTNDGVLWIGTYSGLYRYNGSEFRYMNDFDSVKNVNCLYLDEEGRLWIGTNDNGLSISINERITKVVDEESGLPANSVRCITKCADGNYYIGTTSSMQILTLTGGMQAVATIPEVIYGHSISADKKENVATVTNDGKLFLLREEKVVDSLQLDREQEIYTCCTFREDGLLYVGTSANHIYRYEVESGHLKKKDTWKCGNYNSINSIYFSEENQLYVCTDSGVGYFEKEKFVKVNTNEFNNSIDDMTMDYQGNLWFTSSRLGLLKLSESPFTDIYRAAGLEEQVVNAVVRWQDDFYFGTDTGLSVVDKNFEIQEKNQLVNLLEGVRIRCLLTDSENHLWICTYGRGLIEVDETGKIITYDSKSGNFGDWVRMAIQLSSGEILVSSDVGVTYFKNQKAVNTLRLGDGFSNSMILSMLEREDGRVLCGTDGDGLVILKDGKVESRLTKENGLSSEVILRIVDDKQGEGAFVVTSNGLCYMDQEVSIRLLERFPYSNNYDMWTDESGTVFVLSSAGIYVVDREKLVSGTGELEYELLNAKRGLKAALTVNSWNYVDESGNLYLSCDKGVYKMNTSHYSMAKRSYRMMVSSIRLDNELNEVERGTAFHIDRGISKIEIYPEVINYTVEDPYVSYYLEGIDAEPTVLSQSEITSVVYMNIPSGTYQFHLSVLDGKGEKVLEQSTYELVKEDEFYDTQLFRIYFFVVAMIAVAWLTWFIARTQIQRTLNFQRRQLEFAEEQVRMGNETILAIAKTVDAKDENTSQHSQRVSEYSVMIARELGFSEDECENLRKAALLHDIGKIGIPDRVLNKPARLNDEEYEIMKSHVTRGSKILKDFTLVNHVIDGVLYHHERYDGHGYPQGLKGEEIPLYGRIIGVADAFDAMTANRVYRKQMDFDFVLSELKRCRGTQFDPQMLDILLKLIEEKKIDVDQLYQDSTQKSE